MRDLALAVTFLRRGGWSRAVLVAVCTGLVSGLLLVAVVVLRVGDAAGFAVAEDGGTTTYPGTEVLGNLVSDEGVRPGYVFALLLVCLGPLALLQQAVRLGTAARERRLAALRVAGATPGEVRRLAAWEVGLPALVGGLLGYPVFLALRGVFGGVPETAYAGQWSRELMLVPTTVSVPAWQVLSVAALAGGAGVLAGVLASRRVVVSPLGLSRRTRGTAPRPWLALALAAASAGLLALSVRAGGGDAATAIAGVLCAVLAVLAVASWAAYRLARLVARRASSVPALLAARRLVADPRPAGRAAASAGAIALIAGAGGPFLLDLTDTAGGDGASLRDVEALYLVPVILVGVVLLATLGLVVLSMTVHSVESLSERKRAVASLGALGIEEDVLVRALRWEVGLAAVPVTIIGVVLSSAVFGLLSDDVTQGFGVLVVGLVDVTVVGLVLLAVLATSGLTRPWLRRAVDPGNLRTA